MTTDLERKADTGFSPELMEYIETWKDKPGNLIMILHMHQVRCRVCAVGFANKE